MHHKKAYFYIYHCSVTSEFVIKFQNLNHEKISRAPACGHDVVATHKLSEIFV